MTEHDTSRNATTHDTGTGKGEEQSSSDGKEAGRHDSGASHADRPAGGSTARDSTGINADEKEPIDPNMPSMPPS